MDTVVKAWPLISLFPDPINAADAVRMVSAFADRTAFQCGTSPEKQTAKRLKTLQETVQWTMERFPLTSDQPPPMTTEQVPSLVRTAEAVLDAKLVRVEPDTRMDLYGKQIK